MTTDESTDELRPPRHYSWPPFEEGNTAALRHGAYSARKVNPIADAIVDALLAEAARPGTQVAYLLEPSYGPALRRYAALEAAVDVLRSFLDGLTDWETGWPGELDADGEVRPAADLLVKREAAAAKAAERLGLDPLSRSKLGRDVAATQVDLAQVQAAGAASLAARPPIPATITDHEESPDVDPAP